MFHAGMILKTTPVAIPTAAANRKTIRSGVRSSDSGKLPVQTNCPSKGLIQYESISPPVAPHNEITKRVRELIP
jgi:hypothetical protein